MNDEIIKSIKSDKIKFECKQCGGCCSGVSGYIWLTEIEQSSIADLLKISVADFLKKYTISVNGKISLKETRKSRDDYWCIFLENSAKCRIYERRPHQCRSYPFWENIVTNENNLNAVLADCPGVQRNNG